MKIIPKKSKMKVEIFAGLAVFDLVLMTLYIGMLVLIVTTNIVLFLKIILCAVVIIVGVVSFVKVNDIKGYRFILYSIRFLIDNKKYSLYDEQENKDVNVFCPFLNIHDDVITYLNGECAVLFEIVPNNFHYNEEIMQEYILDNIGEVLKQFSNHSFMKLEKPLNIKPQIEVINNEYEKNKIKNREDGDIGRQYILKKNIEHFEELQKSEILKKDVFYFIVYLDKNLVEQSADRIIYELSTSNIEAKRLHNEEISFFLGAVYGKDTKKQAEQLAELDSTGETYSYDLVDIALPESIIFETSKMQIDDEKYCVFILNDYPTQVENCWAYSLLSLPDIRATIHSRGINSDKARNILDKSIIELKRRISESEREKESVQNTLNEQLATLQILLERVMSGNELLHEVRIIILVKEEMRKEALMQIKRCAFNCNHLPFRMKEGLCAVLPHNNTFLKEFSREINSLSYVAFYPFISNDLLDTNGIYIGKDEDGYPIFFDIDYHFNSSDISLKQSAATRRTNGNLFNIGAPGGGKSYFNKTAMMEWMAKGDSVAIIDPEAEYLKQTMLFEGEIIDVGGGKENERINPFQVFPPLEDDESDVETQKTIDDLQGIYENVGVKYNEKNFKYSFGNYEESPLSTHRIFLSQFFKIAIPNMDEDCSLKLSSLVGELYTQFKITDKTDYAKLKNSQYPIMDDLFKLLKNKLKAEKDSYDNQVLKRLANYIEAFTSSGMYGRIWNGHTTLDLKSDFMDFNFRGLLANKNNVVANAQMLLVLRYLENIIIKNREKNKSIGAKKHIRIVIDEAHLFIDERNPEALNFMYGMAKRIRKYYGSIIITTQNFKDFLGRTGELNAKASAVINACQYKCLFPLSADDINALENLYQSSAPLTDAENQTLKSLQRGEMLFMITDKKRMKVNVSILDGQEAFVAAI